MRNGFGLLFTLLLMGSVFASGAQDMRPGDAASFVAPKDKALVVFVRPSKLGKAVYFYVVDEKKQLVTLFKGNEHVAIAAPPGKHTFYIVSENAVLVRAELGAGRTYIISTRAKMGLGKARVRVEPVLRGSPSFAQSVQWLRDTKPGDPDFDKGAKWVRKHQPVLDKRIGEAEAEWSAGDAKYRTALSMGVEDGRTAEEAGAL